MTIIPDVVENKTKLKPPTSRVLSLIVQWASIGYSNVPGCWNSNDSNNSKTSNNRILNNGNGLGQKKNRQLFHFWWTCATRPWITWVRQATNRWEQLYITKSSEVRTRIKRQQTNVYSSRIFTFVKVHVKVSTCLSDWRACAEVHDTQCTCTVSIAYIIRHWDHCWPRTATVHPIGSPVFARGGSEVAGKQLELRKCHFSHVFCWPVFHYISLDSDEKTTHCRSPESGTQCLVRLVRHRLYEKIAEIHAGFPSLSWGFDRRVTSDWSYHWLELL